MFLKRFSRPKWQHPDPDTRRQAIGELAADDPVFEEIIRADAEPAVRSAAVCACGLLDTVARAWRTDTDAGVRKAALNRIGLLLAGQPGDAEEQARRLRLLGEIQDAEVLGQVARQARDAEIRGNALQRIDDAAVLLKLAQAEEPAELRMQVLERITSAEALQELARHWRGRDKRIYKRARELAEQAAAAARRPLRIAELCAAMQDLADGRGTLAHDAIKTLLDGWSEVAEYAEAEQRQSFEAAHQAATQALEAFQQARQRKHDLQQICDRVTARIDALRGLHELQDAELAEFEAAVAELRADWQQAGGDEDTSPADLRQQYQQSLHRLIEQRERLVQHHQRADALRRQLEEAQKLLDDERLTPAAVRHWQDRFEQLPMPADTALAQEFRARGKDLGQRLAERAQSRRQLREQAMEEIDTELGELDSLLDQGHLQPAINSLNAVRRRIDALGALPGDRQRRVERHMQHAATRIRELRGWRRWGSNQAREELIEAAEALVGSELPPRQLAERIKALRDQWQKLDRTDTATNESLWEKFNALCTQAYEPCKHYFKQQEAEREAQIQVREQQCRELEDWSKALDWEAPEWKEIDRRLGQFRRAWREAPPIQGRSRRKLEDRFHKLLDAVESRLTPERERNQAERRQLVERAAELAGLDDVRSAVEQAKQLQHDWVVTVSARRRRDDQKLWQAFRGHLDAVFARRDAEVSENRQQRDAAARTVEQLCEELEKLAAAGEDVQALRQAGRDAARRRGEAGAIPRNRERALEQRLEQAQRALRRRIDELDRARQLAGVQALATHGECCARLEENVLAGAEDVEQRLVDCERQVADLPELDAEAQAAFEARRLAVRGLDPRAEATARQLQTNGEALQALTLRLEILAGVDSPPELQRERLAMQVDRLSAAMGEGEAAGSGLLELLREWHLLGPVSGELRARLAAREQKVRATIA